jgi:hypothetical protein
MNDFNEDPDAFARYVRDAERMRAEAVRELLVAVWSRLMRVGATIGNGARRLAERRKWNLSVPAPHR